MIEGEDDPRVDAQRRLERRIANALRAANIAPDLYTVAALLLVADRLQRMLGVDRASWRRMLDVAASHDPDDQTGGLS